MTAEVVKLVRKLWSIIMIKMLVVALLFFVSGCFLSLETDKGKLVYIDGEEECVCYEEEACACTEEERPQNILEDGAKSAQD